MTAKSPIQHILTPETEKHFFTDQILPPLLRGESLTIFWVPHAGVRTQMTFLAKHSNLLGFKKLGKHIFAYINPNELIDNNPESYFQLMTYCLVGEYQKNENVSFFFVLKEKLKEFTKNKYQIIFILPYFDRLDYPITFFNNLVGLYEINKNKIHFIFIISKNIFSGNKIEKYGQLGEVLAQNKIYFPLLSKNDSDYVLSKMMNKYSYKISIPNRRLAQTLAGGHPAFLLTCLRIIAKNQKSLPEKIKILASQRWEIRKFLESIWNSFSKDEKSKVLNFINRVDKKGDESLSYLTKLKIIVGEGDNFRMFSPLFQSFLESQSVEKKTLSVDEKTGEILVNGLPPKEKITLHEHRLLLKFLGNPNKTISRDEIAEILWGENSFQKYSDWAIDQTISLLRKKIELFEISPDNIQTIKGRGYRWLG